MVLRQTWRLRVVRSPPFWDNWSGFNWRGKNPDTDPNFTVTWIDEEYGKTIQWKILRGRDFSREHSTDVNAVVINKAAADYIGFKNIFDRSGLHNKGI